MLIAAHSVPYIVEGMGRRQKPLLQPIVTECPFQIVGVDIMELPITARGNRYVCNRISRSIY